MLTFAALKNVKDMDRERLNPLNDYLFKKCMGEEISTIFQNSVIEK
jgi:hypothetical protein